MEIRERGSNIIYPINNIEAVGKRIEIWERKSRFQKIGVWKNIKL